ncbi:MAG: tRNA pseudouridine(13) synthase TruD, partial [Planctomycetota bacterium]
GGRGDAWRVGREIVRGNLSEALDIVLGRPSAADRGSIRHARELYEAGHYEQAVSQWPGMFRDERRALRTLARTKGRKKRAFLAIDKNLRRFYVSAFQSYLFNQVVARRMATGLHRLVQGDLAWRHANGAVFEVLDVATEQPRADAFEISPSGPLFGYRMTQPKGRAAEIENAVLAEAELQAEDFRAPKLRVKGARRALRCPVRGASIRLGADDRGAYLELRFELPRGSYATSLLRELFVENSSTEAAAQPDDALIDCD